MSTAAAAPSSHTSSLVLADRLVPRRGVLTDVALVAGGVVVVSLLALVQFRIGPVPITGQTLGVMLVGSALGMRRGAATLVTYLLVGLAGAPVFAGGGGPAYVTAPSFGYLIGFVAAAAIAGWAAERAWDRHVGLAMVGFLLATAAPFLVGVPYMAALLQLSDPAAIAAIGVTPFIVPGIIKAGVAAAIFPAAWAVVRRLDADR
ncbi:BioY protein [Serinicoccus sp. CNJ-927]|uniref:biotin transporter BioY n=1 Tax=unclassified Serinicoccus TaxID=2643101 RepID=UPI000963A7E6|nr:MULTISPECIES: biotin transporter BioY [unclassified Serinicoccus]OLT16699.1 BioY protein [Serinicoccus sp. CUA-874]OLT43686.1 BioY protein [Serinicoccus sp. CNJ-927]